MNCVQYLPIKNGLKAVERLSLFLNISLNCLCAYIASWTRKISIRPESMLCPISLPQKCSPPSLPDANCGHTFQSIHNAGNRQTWRIVNEHVNMIPVVRLHCLNREIGFIGYVKHNLFHGFIHSVNKNPLPVFGHENDVSFEQKLAMGRTFVFFLIFHGIIVEN